jgi:hypothetical protein
MRTLVYLAALSSLVLASGASAMTYTLVPFQDGSATIVARGKIEGNEVGRLVSLVQQAQARGVMPRTLMISSPGGNLASALHLGQALRQLGLQTTVGSVTHDAYGQRALTSGSCHSACVMVLMGGVGRSVLPGSQVGVHSPRTHVMVQGQHYVLDDASSRRLADPAMRSYTRRMGVSPALIDAANAVPHTSIRTLTPAEMARFGLVTSGYGRGNAVRHRGRA